MALSGCGGVGVEVVGGGVAGPRTAHFELPRLKKERSLGISGKAVDDGGDGASCYHDLAIRLIERIGFPCPGGVCHSTTPGRRQPLLFQPGGFAVYHPVRGATDVRVTTPYSGETTGFVNGLPALHILSYTSLPSFGKPCAHYSAYVGFV